MKLVTFGDSWVWGDELEPKNILTPDGVEYDHNYNIYRHENNIGGIVNKNHTFTEYINYATNGGSNQHIIYDLMNYINSDDYDENDLVLIGMTSPLRNIIYSNISKTPITWPGWDYDSYTSYCDISLKGNKDFEKWWKSNVKIHLNKRNDILNYAQTCLSIKSLLTKHSKYLVWQSIDGNFWDYEKDFEEVYLEKYKLNSEESDLKTSCKNNFIFKKESLDKELKRGTSEKQIWINIEHQDWKSWLEDNYEHDDVFVWSSNHPNQKGITNWYDLVLSDKIKKIIH